MAYQGQKFDGERNPLTGGWVPFLEPVAEATPQELLATELHRQFSNRHPIHASHAEERILKAVERVMSNTESDPVDLTSQDGVNTFLDKTARALEQPADDMISDLQKIQRELGLY